jgi:hypothetical protein
MNARGWICVLVLAWCMAVLIPPAGAVQAPGSNAPSPITLSKAYCIVLDEVLKGTTEGRWVFGDPDPVAPGTVIHTWYGNITLPGESGWVVFIDDQPMANWAHPCRYVFVNAQGAVQVFDALAPPGNLEDWDRLETVTCPGDQAPGTTVSVTGTPSTLLATSPPATEPVSATSTNAQEIPGFGGILAGVSLVVSAFALLKRR